MEQGEAVIDIGGEEQILVPDLEGRRVHRYADILIAELDLLHLGRGAAVPGIGNAVAAEIVVGGTLPKIAAVGLEPVAVAVLLEDGLVDVIPDEAALVAGILPVGQLGILVQCAAGITHGMAVFTVDEGPHVPFGQVCLDVSHLGIHPALHIGGLGIARVPEPPFVVDQAGVVQSAHHVGHLIHGLAAEGLIAQRPDDDRRMVFVPLIGGPHPGHQHRLPFGAVVGQQEIFSPDAVGVGVPGAVGLLVVFGDHVQAVPIAQIVQHILILVVAGPHRVDVVLLHGADVLLDLLMGTGPAGYGAELVPVGALEHNPLAVDEHPVVLHLELAEAHFLGPVLHRLAGLIVQHNFQVIEGGHFGAPESGMVHAAAQLGAPIQGNCLREQLLCPIPQGQHSTARTRNGQPDIQIGVGEVLPLEQGPHRQVLQMHLRDGVEPDAAEDARKAVKVLVLAPAGGRPFEDLGGQLVDAGLDVRGQVKGVGRKAVLGVAHIAAVEPEGHPAFDTLKFHPQGLILHGFGELEAFHIARHRVEPLGDLTLPDILPAIPGILGVGILGQVITLHLDVGRHPNLIPKGAVVIFPLKAGDGACMVFRVGKLPGTIQLEGQRALPCQHFLAGGIALAAGVGRQDVLLEKGGIFYLCIVKCSHGVIPHFKKTLLLRKGAAGPPAQTRSFAGRDDEGEVSFLFFTDAKGSARITSPRR